MLQTQVNYWTLMENRRHNIVSEALGYDTLSETKRHNVVSEELGFGQLHETIRHNRATEDIGWADIGVKSRTAGANEMNAYTNQFSAREAQRHNKVAEDIGYLNASASLTQAGAAASQAATAQQKQDFAQKSWVKDKQIYFQYELPLRQQSLNVDVTNAETNQYRADTERLGIYTKAGTEAVKNALGVLPLLLP